MKSLIKPKVGELAYCNWVAGAVVGSYTDNHGLLTIYTTQWFAVRDINPTHVVFDCVDKNYAVKANNYQIVERGDVCRLQWHTVGKNLDMPEVDVFKHLEQYLDDDGLVKFDYIEKHWKMVAPKLLRRNCETTGYQIEHGDEDNRQKNIDIVLDLSDGDYDVWLKVNHRRKDVVAAVDMLRVMGC